MPPVAPTASARRPRKGRAFTLVELIVVLVVIAILVTVASFAYRTILNRSADNATATMLTQLHREASGLAAQNEQPLSVNDFTLAAADAAPVALGPVTSELIAAGTVHVVTGVAHGPDEVAVKITTTSGGTTVATLASVSSAGHCIAVSGPARSPRRVNLPDGTACDGSTAPAGAATVPDAPSGTATAGDASATVDVTAPANDGGATIAQYRVTCTPATGSVVTATAASSPVTVTGMTNNTAYTCTVAAQNSAGWSAEGSAGTVTPKAAPTAPGTPTGTATAGDTVATVTFTAPASDGGASINNYRATCVPASGPTANATGAGSPITVTGLTNGVAYSCTIAAHNSVGWSAEGAAGTVTPSGPVNFVAVQYSGKIVTSSDAVVWTPMVSISGMSGVQAVEYAGNLWFALGTDGKIATSPDAKTWTVHTTGYTAALNDVEGNPTDGYMAVGASQVILYSPDGNTWSYVSGYPKAATLTDVERFNGRWYVTAQGTYSSAYYTSDRVNWTALSVNGQTLGTFSYTVANGYLYTVPGNGTSSAQGTIYKSATGNSDNAWTKGGQIMFGGNTSGWTPWTADAAGNLYINQINSSGAARVFTSTNAGTTWTQYATTVAPANTWPANVDAIAARGSTIVFAGRTASQSTGSQTGYNALKVSQDGGATFTNVTTIDNTPAGTSYGWRDVASR